MKCVLSLIMGSVASAALDCSAPWEFAGPNAWVSGSDELQTVESEGEDGQLQDLLGSGSGYANLPASTSTHRIAAGKHGTWLAATANAGIWRTKNISVQEPHWEPVTDNNVTCVAMSSLEVSTFNPDLVVASCGGSTSGELAETWNVLISGEWKGVMLSKDGGETWGMTTFPPNYNIGSVRFLSPSTLLVAARGNFFDPLDGGIWKSKDLGKTWEKVFAKPTVEIVVVGSQVVAALGADPEISWHSLDEGQTWQPFSQGIDFNGYIPFYTHMAASSTSPPTVFMAVYAVNPTDQDVDHSLLWSRTLGSSKWLPVANTPDSLDVDKMPKDKIAVLPDPTDASILYVAANLGNIYRVEGWATAGAKWIQMGNGDTADGSSPHADCRHLAWDHSTGDLLMSNDGGVHRRTQPGTPGGRWYGSAGDIRTMEYSYAAWDARNLRYIAGAQDNSVQITKPRSAPGHLKLRATGVVGGDGTRAFIDNVHCPSRMFGSCQFLGGLSYFSSGADGALHVVRVPLGNNFTSPYNFPYFVGAAALNSQDPSQLFFYANGTTTQTPPGVYRLTVPDSTTHTEPRPQLVAKVEGVLDLVAGGYSEGKPDPTAVFMVTTDALHTLRNGTLSSVPFPMRFFTPVTLHATADGRNKENGPLSHGNTMWLSVSAEDSKVLAVTGWPADLTGGQEMVFFTRDGTHFTNVLGNLKEAVGATSRVRPQGVLVVTLDQVVAVLVGTVNGVYVTFSDSFAKGAQWTRVSSLSSGTFPLVFVAGLSYEPYTDTLVAATYGRGAFILEKAKQGLQLIHDQQKAGSCDVAMPAVPASSAKFFPPQQSC